MVRVVAHRGFSARAPENTLAAFRLAVYQECDDIELDIQLTGRLEPAVIHDAWVDRTSSGTGLVCEMTLADLAGLDAGSWFGPEFQGEPIPSLRDVLQLISPTRVGLILELKDCAGLLEGGIPVVAETIREAEMSGRVIVKSFQLEAVRRFRQLEPDIECGALFNAATDYVGETLACGAGWLSISRRLVSQAVVEDAHRKGLKVLVWTVDAAAHIEAALRLGVDGIISNSPDRVQELVGRPGFGN